MADESLKRCSIHADILILGLERQLLSFLLIHPDHKVKMAQNYQEQPLLDMGCFTHITAW